MPSVIGTQGNDNLFDTIGDDAILGLGGADAITVTSGRDVIDGGAGVDRLIIDYSLLTSAVVNNGENAFDNASGNSTTAVTFDDVENLSVTTGSGDDIIRTFYRDDIGDPNNSTIVSGNDYILSGDGNDQIAGGGGNDELHGGEGNDVIDGDGSLRGKFGGNLGDFEFIGDDTLFGDAGDDDIYGGNGSDILNGGIGDDELYGDRIAFRATDGTALGGPSVQIQMSTGNDLLSGNDTLDGGEGDDLLVGNAGNDIILGGSGTDTARVTITSDGADQVDLGTGNDSVEVSANANSEVSSRVRLTFTSAEIGNANASDSNTMANQDGGYAVRMQSENYADGLVGPISRYDDEGITFVASQGVTFDVRDLVSGVARGDQFEVVSLGTNDGDVMTAVQNARPYYFNGGQGNDFIAGGDANDFLVGGGGDDRLYGGAGNDTFLGGAGADLLVGEGGTDTMSGGAGNDVYGVDSATDAVTEAAGEGYDVTYSAANSYQISANVEELVLSGDALVGYGNGAANVIYGSATTNVINGGGGSDVLIGGGSADYFLFLSPADSGIDTVSDFSRAEGDKIGIGASAFQFGQIVDGDTFVVGAATLTHQQLLYDDANGLLYYDSDGTGSQAAIALAQFTGAPPLAASDFILV